jgi:hypothetical protein
MPPDDKRERNRTPFEPLETTSLPIIQLGGSIGVFGPRTNGKRLEELCH